MDIAERCKSSKAKVYHYFPSKDRILFQLLQEYCLFVIQSFESIDPKLPAEERLRTFLESFIRRPTRMRNRHIALVNDLKYLPPELKRQIVSLERRLMSDVVVLLKQVQKIRNVDDRVLRTYVLLLFGTINGIDTWFNPSGAMTSDELSRRLCRLFIDGICKTP